MPAVLFLCQVGSLPTRSLCTKGRVRAECAGPAGKRAGSQCRGGHQCHASDQGECLERFQAARGDRGVGVINQSMARRYWPNEDPVGKVIETPRIVRVRTPQGWDVRFIPEQFQIVGVVGDVRHLSLDYGARPEMFLLYSQMATSDFTFLLRSSVDPQRNLGGEPQSATGRCPHHGSTDRPGCSQSPLRAAASDGVRASRGLARGGGHLRRHCALSVAAHAGDRHSHGAGRGCAGGDPHHGLANAAVGWGRARCRRDRSAGDRAAFIPARDAARVDPAIALRCE